ncbi:threonine dehydratase [Roseibacterium sp. SDUM158016]|uniref:threonine dehydratase n=1 Tax=Roseicyclus sediminis TaxID=2980997 RepID=UPI0021D33D7D|nr:threonine dehydratase [Roseibacterium sp. SDUM158016]MCU4653967.1 threonine dehydratase [Roseibacterium sp. SDUM158016]
MQFTKDELEAAHALVTATMFPTPQHAWPLLAERVGAEVFVKHENHTPTGSFKVRGALTFIDWLTRTHPEVTGICTATRGNHGQGQAWAATRAGLTAKVYVPRGNSVEKNSAMRAFGAELIEFGEDFDTAREEAYRVAAEENLFIVPPFHRELVRGVATYGYELFTAVPDLDAVYVPIGCGSGICGTIAARDALGAKAEVIGVVSENAPTAKLSVEAGRPIETDSARTFADGMAVRVPVPEALAIYGEKAARILTVSDAEVAGAIRAYYTDTHNLAEGAGAAPLAALIRERDRMQGKKVAVILCGGNIDQEWFVTVLEGGVPAV